MSIIFKVSNSLEALSQALATHERERQRGVFEPLRLITQVEGMNAWLKMKLAEQNGIAANIEFLSPNQLINKIFFALGGSYQQPLPQQAVVWIIFGLLGEKQFQLQFEQVSGYYFSDGKMNDVKRYGLAEKIADLFDQYQIYRPEMLAAWNEDKAIGIANENWQKWLWQSARNAGGKAFPDKSEQGDFILKQLKNPDAVQSLKSRFPEVNLFGLSIITRFHVGLFHELADVIDVNLFLLNPAPEFYWVDDKSPKAMARMKPAHRGKCNEGNELLTDLANVQKETFQLLFEHEKFMNAYEEVGSQPPLTDSLLHLVQHDIFNAAIAEMRQPVSAANLTDGTITIYSNYTEAREVETLYNYLVRLVENEPNNIAPRDILVLLPDVSVYAPYVKAVFDNAPYHFPYHIADEQLISAGGLLDGLQQLLELSEEDFTAADVLDLLHNPLIRNKFRITDLELIRDCVQAAGIRFGIENNRDDETWLVSWKYGLQRIVYGLAISGSPEVNEGVESFYPIDMAEGLVSAQVMRFVTMVQLLIQFVEQRKTRRNVQQWAAYVEDLAAAMLIHERMEKPEEQVQLQNILSDFSGSAEVFAERIPYQVFSKAIIEKLAIEADNNIFSRPGITFCSLIPMRSIPHKVVAVLGMNHTAFPRKEKTVTFDLIKANPQRGDRNRKDNDKNLFLEILLAAKNYFFVSYLGRKAEDNSSLPPSSVVDSLIGYIDAGLADDALSATQLVVHQPLHSHSRKYNMDDGSLYSYLLQNPEPITYFKTTSPEIEPAIEEIDWQDLKAFFNDGIKYYFNKVLKVYYSETISDDIEVHEVFELDRLRESGLFRNLAMLPTSEVEAFISKEKKTGGLPLSNTGVAKVLEIDDALQSSKERLAELTNGMQPEVLQVDCTINLIRVKGSIANVFGNSIVLLSKTKNVERHYRNLMLDCLLAAAAGYEVNGFLLNVPDDEHAVEKFDQAFAVSALQSFVAEYLQGKRSITPYSHDMADNTTIKNFVKALESLSNYNPYISKWMEMDFDEAQAFEKYKEINQLFELNQD